MYAYRVNILGELMVQAPAAAGGTRYLFAWKKSDWKAGCGYNTFVRSRLVMLVLLIAALGCSLPPAATPTPTALPVTPVSLAGTVTPASAVATSAITPQAPRATIQPTPTAHRIAIRQLYGLGEFYDPLSGQTFVPRGVNYFYRLLAGARYEDHLFAVGASDLAQVAGDFQRLRDAGYNTVRLILDDCTSGPGCIGNPDGDGINPAYLDNIVAVMNLAKENGLVMLLASLDLPEQGGYASLANQGSGEAFAPYRNSYYLTDAGIQAYRTYWADLLSGLAARSAPFDAVLGWELVAEQWYQGDQPPFSLTEGEVTAANGQTYDLADPLHKQALAVEGMQAFIAELRPVILTYDPGALTGMGFFTPAYPNPARQDDPRYVETAGLLTGSDLDFFDFHAYPANELSLAELAENFGLSGQLTAPVLMGETGAISWVYDTVEAAANAMQDWIAASCEYGFDGWYYWGYSSSSEAAGGYTWGFTGPGSFLMEAISPLNQPDACLTTVLPGRNLALGRPVTVSAALPAEPAEQAVDGSAAQWGAGAFAEQWLMIDLGGPQTIGAIRLLVGQWPAGPTSHQLFAAGPDGAMRLLAEFQDYTRDFDLLEYLPVEPLSGIQYIRVVTLDSPAWVAWREIEVLAPMLPTPTATVSPDLTPTP